MLVMAMIIMVTPIHGYGWTDSARTIETPGSFTVEVASPNRQEVKGAIKTEIAEFAGADFEASPRHVEDDQIYTCVITTGSGVTISGYCILDFAHSSATPS
jgi:hypothetical protein